MAGNSWNAVSNLWTTVLPRLLQPSRGADGHGGPYKQLHQLHPVLPDVCTVQEHHEDYLLNRGLCHLQTEQKKNIIQWNIEKI